jgi:hypothetical protein
LQFSDIPLTTDLDDIDKKICNKPFNLEEIKIVVFYMKHNRAPDRVSHRVFQKFWDLIKLDLLSLFMDFYKGNLDIQRFNYVIVIWLAKGLT